MIPACQVRVVLQGDVSDVSPEADPDHVHQHPLLLQRLHGLHGQLVLRDQGAQDVGASRRVLEVM